MEVDHFQRHMLTHARATFQPVAHSCSVPPPSLNGSRFTVTSTLSQPPTVTKLSEKNAAWNCGAEGCAGSRSCSSM